MRKRERGPKGARQGESDRKGEVRDRKTEIIEGKRQ
jgi:hypothetical protein